MKITIDDFIKRLEQISSDKRKLPLVIDCPNGMQVSPNIKMRFKDGIMFTKDSELESMVITWQD